MTKMRLLVLLAVLGVAPRAGAQLHDFPLPSDDRWHYPFNSTPGTRPVASCFGAGGYSAFNDRDGIALVAWNTAAAIPPGLGAAAYPVAAVRVTLTNVANAQWPIDLTVDEWFTHDVNGDGLLNADGIPRGQPGDTDGESDDADPGRPVELFGAGFGPIFAPADWNEFTIYVGSDSFIDFPRDPFPFVFRDADGAMLHVEDTVKGFHNAGLAPPLCGPPDDACPFTPVPWSVGVPIGYSPGAQPAPFNVTFDVNLSQSSGRVREYFQQQLDAGRVIVAVSSLRETAVMGGQNGYPTFYMKESTDPLAVPGRLTVVLGPCTAGDGDINCDGQRNAVDVALFAAVLLGSDVDPGHVLLSDINASGRPDAGDIQPFVNALLGNP